MQMTTGPSVGPEKRIAPPAGSRYEFIRGKGVVAWADRSDRAHGYGVCWVPSWWTSSTEHGAIPTIFCEKPPRTVRSGPRGGRRRSHRPRARVPSVRRCWVGSPRGRQGLVRICHGRDPLLGNLDERGLVLNDPAPKAGGELGEKRRRRDDMQERQVPTVGAQGPRVGECPLRPGRVVNADDDIREAGHRGQYRRLARHPARSPARVLVAPVPGWSPILS